MKINVFRKSILVMLVLGLSFGLTTSAFSATTNTASSKPLILIGGSGIASVVTIVESGAGALSGTPPTNTLTLTTPTGVTFRTGTAPTATFGGDLTLTTPATVTGGTVATFTITRTGTTAPVTIIISNIELTLATTVAPGDIALTIGPPANTGLTTGPLVVAAATNAQATAQLSGVPEKIRIAGTPTANLANTVLITEATAGALLAAGAARDIVLQLPAGVTFDAAVDPSASVTIGDLELGGVAAPGAVAPNNINAARDTVSWRTTTVSTAASVITISNLRLVAAASVQPGPVNAVLTSGTALNVTLQIATAANRGIVAVPRAAGAAFVANAAALTTLPSTPAGRPAVTAASINVTENFPDDIGVTAAGANVTDTFQLTLPAGVTFANAPGVAISDVAAAVVGNPIGTNVLNLTADRGTVGATGGGFVIGTAAPNTIQIAVGPSVPAGDIVAVLSGTVGGTAITAIQVPIATVVTGAVTVTPNTTIPTIGIGSSAAFGTFTIVENAPGTLLANADTLVLTLPAGVTFSAAPTAAASVTTGAALTISSPAIRNANNTVATFTITAPSTGATTITISGSIALGASAAPGPINAAISGTAGATGSVLIANSSSAVTASSSGIPTLTPGLPTQAIGNLIITEAIANGLPVGANFRLVLPNGFTWSSVGFAAGQIVATEVPVGSIGAGFAIVGSDGLTPDVASTTFTPNDTLIFTTPGAGSASLATITISGLSVNVPAGAANGPVVVNLVNGNATGANGAGIVPVALTMGVIGTVAPVAVAPATLTLAAGGSADALVSGGLGAITVSSSDATVATAFLTGTTLTVNGVAAGSAVITLTDSAATPTTATLNVTVVAVTPVGVGPGILPAVSVSATTPVELNLSADTAGATAVNTWFVLTGRVAGTQLPIFLVTSTGLVQVTAGMDLNAAAFPFTGPTLTFPAMTMADLGLAAGDQMVYAFAFMDAQGNLVIPNIVTIDVI